MKNTSKTGIGMKTSAPEEPGRTGSSGAMQGKHGKLLKAGIAAKAAAVVILIAGAWPLGGAPAVYHSGFLLSLGALIGLLCLCAGARMAGKRWLRLLPAALLAFIAAGCLCGAWMYAKAGIEFALSGEWKWLGSLGRWVTALALLGIAGVAAAGVHRLMDVRLWLAAAHFSLAVMGIGCFSDYAGEVKGTLFLTAAEEGAPVPMQHGLHQEGRSYPFGFSIGLLGFSVEYYDDAPCGLYAYEEGQWKLKRELTPREGVLHVEEGLDVPLGRLKTLSGMPHPMYVLEDGRVLLKGAAPVKSYDALCTVTTNGRDEKRHVRVNEPLAQGGWLFYLADYREVHGRPGVYLTARYAPGRPWMLGGMGALLVSTAFWCWTPRRGRAREQRDNFPHE